MDGAAKGALAVGGIVVAGVAAYAGYKYLLPLLGGGRGGFLLQLLPGTGGKTNPASSPSGIMEPAGTVVTITAIPDSGYTIGQWILDGQDAGTSPSLTVTMNMDHTVIVTFWQGGQPPPSAPYAIQPLGGSATAWGFYGCRLKLGTLGNIIDTQVHNCDQNWTWDNWAQYQAQFKVIDATGKGVPNVLVTLYPDMFPDNGNNVGLIGYLALNLWPHTNSDPLQLTTDENGIVTFSMTYVYGILDDHFLKLCKAAQLYVDTISVFIPLSYTPFDGAGQNGEYQGILTKKGGEGITNDHPSTMGYFALNSVHAIISGTSIQVSTLPIYCGFHVKMLPNYL